MIYHSFLVIMFWCKMIGKEWVCGNDLGVSSLKIWWKIVYSCRFRLDVRKCSGGGKCARIEAIECHECSRERVHGTKWGELWMRIEENSDSYRQEGKEGTASLTTFVSSRKVVLSSRKEERRTSTPRVFCTNWTDRMSRMQSRASVWDQVRRAMDENRRKQWFL